MGFRIKAFSIHLLISLLAGLLSLALVFLVWYPSPLYQAAGVGYIFWLMLGIDLIIGPLITLTIANPNKSRGKFKFDLVVIAILQLIAYGYGLYSIESGRPRLLVFDTKRVEYVEANSIGEGKAPEAWFGPEWMAVKPAQNDKERSDRLFYELDSGLSPSRRPELYESLEKAWPQILKVKHELSELKQYNAPDEVAAVLVRYPEADAYLPLLSPVLDMTILINSKNQQVVKIVNLRPWKS